MLLQVNIEPYARLFTTVLKWQKAEKKWTDGSFLELNAVQIENDINAFSRYKHRMKKSQSTVEIGRLRRNSARLRHSALCSIYGVKTDLPKNSRVLWSSVVSKLLPLQPKVINNKLNFMKWTIKEVNNFCQNSIKFMLNF